MFEICRVDEEVLPAKEVSPIEIAKDFSELGEEERVESLPNEVKFSFSFALIFPEDVSMMSLRKEESVRSSENIVSSV